MRRGRTKGISRAITWCVGGPLYRFSPWRHLSRDREILEGSGYVCGPASCHASLTSRPGLLLFQRQSFLARARELCLFYLTKLPETS